MIDQNVDYEHQQKEAILHQIIEVKFEITHAIIDVGFNRMIRNIKSRVKKKPLRNRRVHR